MEKNSVLQFKLLVSVIKIALAAISMTVISQQSMAQAVFYCNVTKFIKIADNEATNYKTQNFKFSVNRNLIEFGDSGYFSGNQMPISHWANEDRWTATDATSMIRFRRGQFMYAENIFTFDGVSGLLISATCDKF